MSARLKLVLAFGFALLLMWFPVQSIEAVKEAVAVWADAYLPSMLPFFIVLPVLSCPEACQMYQRLFGRAMGAMFCVPGGAVGAVALGLIAGSPAGSIALARLAQGGRLDRGQLSRAALLCSGLSPLFLLSVVGVSMLGSVDYGMILVRSQLGALALSALGFRWCWRGDHRPLIPQQLEPTGGAVRDAAINLITVCGYMALFGVFGRLISMALGGAPGTAAVSLIEAAGGCAMLARLPWSIDAKLPLMALACCFSGLSILTQNLSRLTRLGLPWGRLVAGKLAQGVLGAALCALQLRLLPRAADAAASAPLFAGERMAALAAAALCAVCAGIVLFGSRDGDENGPRQPAARDAKTVASASPPEAVFRQL